MDHKSTRCKPFFPRPFAGEQRQSNGYEIVLCGDQEGVHVSGTLGTGDDELITSTVSCRGVTWVVFCVFEIGAYTVERVRVNRCTEENNDTTIHQLLRAYRCRR